MDILSLVSMIPFAEPVDSYKPIRTFMASAEEDYPDLIDAEVLDSIYLARFAVLSTPHSEVDDNGDDNGDDSLITDVEITMPLVEFHRHIKQKKYSETKIKALKLARRRYKNRGYSQKARRNRKLNAQYVASLYRDSVSLNF